MVNDAAAFLSKGDGFLVLEVQANICFAIFEAYAEKLSYN
jgi:hypothetical protein